METYSSLINKQKSFFKTEKTKNVDFRIEALQKLRNAIKKNEKTLMESLRTDLNKSEFDAYTSEIGFVLEELRFTVKHLRSWAAPKKVKTPVTHIGSNSYIYPEPYGVALIIAPWNYPFQLAVAPLIGAISAGNCAIIKPSELTPKTSEVLETLIKEIFPEEYIAVVQGGVETSQALLYEQLDYIFFTGSVPVGKIIMESAAKHLTPVTLELGGKSPCIVHEDANLKLAAKRIAWGKFTNAGQTCIAPDYLYVHKSIKDVFLQQFKETTLELYGKEPLKNPDFTRIVSERHFNRLSSFLDNGQLFMGGNTDKERLTIEPTVLTDITWEESIMQDEIFGPLLPVMEYVDLSEVIEGIHRHPKPLALYIFSENNSIQEEVLNKVSFGGGCVNDTVYHFVSPYLPFGGVGTSGIGAYHGKGNFDTFSHQKSVLKQTTKFDIPFRYPNVKNGLEKIKLFMK
ncbi:aldehyde dehydrogenase family protein [Bacillus sp. AFS076308]|uniref:aldehyde dehydrogenase n=1 Tax=unclassified Bacillus (in: firmicutes) TaxID=185979 RepID=UPI000BF3C69A|nr:MULTISPECIES: aldehyde dehydrogenase [unclassified Bacillus (in: firmicutes)]PFN96116.1 aldehyde dehydrogenase family protein [Bacillus sp. AFS076308]PGV56002.1 aldehyde dehydrogenase family protein [Bacillus sp. AFS037270]